VVNEPVVVLDLSKDNYSRVKKACDYLGSSKLSLDIKADRVRVLYAPDPEFTASDEFVRVLEGLAILHYRRGQYVLAERNLLQAQQLTPQDTNALDVADIDDALGWVYRQEGMPAKAKECCRESLSIRKKQLPAGHPDVAQSYLNLANLYYELQDPVKGKKYEAKAIPSLKKYKAGFNLEEIQRIPDEILDSKRSDKSALSAAVKNMHALLQRLCVPTTTKVIAASTKDLQAGKDAQKERSHG
jgi:tetratricopeptide (TPR) repeat protein